MPQPACMTNYRVKEDVVLRAANDGVNFSLVTLERPFANIRIDTNKGTQWEVNNDQSLAGCSAHIV